MKLLHAYELKITKKEISLDDPSLLKKFDRLRHDVKEKKQAFDLYSSYDSNSNTDYLSVTVARLAYEFTKEEYNVFYEEVVKRGLLQVS